MLTRLVLQKINKWFDDEVDPEVRERTAKDGHGELLPVKVSNCYTGSYLYYAPYKAQVRWTYKIVFVLFC